MFFTIDEAALIDGLIDLTLSLVLCRRMCGHDITKRTSTFS